MAQIKKSSKEIKPEERGKINSMFGDYLEEKGIDKENYNLIFESVGKPKILYHYTSLEGLYAILENVTIREVKNITDIGSSSFFTLRGTDITFLNDFSEFEIVPKLLHESIKKIDDELDEAEKKHLANIITPNYLKKIANFFGMFTVHVTSFSENSDNLPMWSTYGHEGKGVAIGLDYSLLREWLDSIDIDKPMLIKCSYDMEIYKKPIVELAKEIYRNFFIKDGKISVSGLVNFDLLAEYFSSLKDFAYEYENEWRLIKVVKNSFEDQPKGQMKNGILKPFIEHSIFLNVLKEIIIGPCSNIELVDKSLKFILNKVKSKTKIGDFDVEIKHSKIPYRLI